MNSCGTGDVTSMNLMRHGLMALCTMAETRALAVGCRPGKLSFRYQKLLKKPSRPFN
jgi:hypothetical protein